MILASTVWECVPTIRYFRTLEEAFEDTDTYVYTIGDSVRARRIMEGTMEGRAILNVLESQGYLTLEPLVDDTKGGKFQMGPVLA